jgi:hypothetical protein
MNATPISIHFKAGIPKPSPILTASCFMCHPRQQCLMLQMRQSARSISEIMTKPSGRKTAAGYPVGESKINPCLNLNTTYRFYLHFIFSTKPPDRSPDHQPFWHGI